MGDLSFVLFFLLFVVQEQCTRRIGETSFELSRALEFYFYFFLVYISGCCLIYIGLKINQMVFSASFPNLCKLNERFLRLGGGFQ